MVDQKDLPLLSELPCPDGRGFLLHSLTSPGVEGSTGSKSPPCTLKYVIHKSLVGQRRTSWTLTSTGEPQCAYPGR